MIKICEFDHLIACSDYFARFLLFKCAFSMKKVMLKNSLLSYVTVRAVKRVELHHRAKFRQNRLNRGRDMAVFRFFKMAAAAILDF